MSTEDGTELAELVWVESPFYGSMSRADTEYAFSCMRECLSRGEVGLHPGIVFGPLFVRKRVLGTKAGLLWVTSAQKMAIYMDHGVGSTVGYTVLVGFARGIPIKIRFLQETPERRRKAERVLEAWSRTATPERMAALTSAVDEDDPTADAQHDLLAEELTKVSLAEFAGPS